MPRVRSRNTPVLGLLAPRSPCGPAAAHAATLTTDARCYAQGAPLRLTAGGLAPSAPLTVALDGRPLRYDDGSTPTADAAGTFGGSFATPALAAGVPQQRHRLSVGDGRRRPRARFTVSRPPGADFQPAGGDPRTLRARFSRGASRSTTPAAARASRVAALDRAARSGPRERRARRGRRRLRRAHDGAAARLPVRSAGGSLAARAGHASPLPRADERPAREDSRARPSPAMTRPSLTVLLAVAVAALAPAPPAPPRERASCSTPAAT